ncbi:MAG: ATP-binding protein [Desulfobacterales bacterium]
MRITNWYVITGAPCSGKTSVISRIEQLGYRVVHETARAYINDELNKGKTLDEIREDMFIFESSIFYRKIKIEAALPEKAIIFLDRAIPDSVAYFRFAGLDPKEPEEKSADIRYRKIFLFDRLRIKQDEVRNENEEDSILIERLIEETYLNLGYKIIRVPVLPLERRVDFIIENL